MTNKQYYEKQIVELKKQIVEFNEQIEQAKKIINQLLTYCVKVEPTDYKLICKAEQFVQE